MARTKYAFDLETYKYDASGNPVRSVSSISVFADSYDEGLAKAKATAQSRTSIGRYDKFQSLAGNSKYYGNKGKYVGVVEDSGKRGTPTSVRGVGSDGSLAKLSGYSYEGEKPLAFSKKLSKEYGGLKEVSSFTPQMIANDPTNKKAPTLDELKAKLLQAQAFLKSGVPTVAGQGMGGASTTNLPTPNYASGNVTGASASVAGLGTLYETLTKQMQDDRKRADELQAQQAKDQKGIMSFLKKQPSQAEIREDAYQDIGIDPADYFADQKAGIAEIEALTKDYNAVVAARDAQIAATNDKLGSMNFINNQIAAIERNSAPKLNEISSQINNKVSVLQALQGNFAEARAFANQAVDDAVAEQKYQLDLFTMFYDMNQDNLNRLEDRYQSSFNTALSLAEKQYDIAREEKMQMTDLILDAAQRGVDLSGYFSGSLDTLVSAYGRQVGAIELADRNDNNTGGGGGGTFTDTQTNKGANNAGVDAATFESYPYEVQNFYINASATQLKDINDAINAVRTGDEDRDDVINEINNSNLSPVVKNFFTTQINSIGGSSSSSSVGVMDVVREIPGTIAGGWNSVRKFLGI